ncbi:hypothetical protein Pmani_010486 [Petrolisthes manimaculis]|uniref:RecA family profile 1 domain-containing protein n=1 Tax=Petrolisthes manimaculis TaxID=1843537 RepID=A0AAE1Q217_9EUCA|nr:hypothetical protein Pmani_010486 [Petrolisthes manimaculis]
MSSIAANTWTRNILDRLDINPKVKCRAQKAGYVSAIRILGASQSELQHKLELSEFHIKNLTAAVASYALPKQETAWEMATQIEAKTHLTTGCPCLDVFLSGGVAVGGVTEVSGQSGSGKTQFGLQLALYAQLPRSLGGIAKGVAYICTESQFPVVRLQQMIGHMKLKYPQGPKSYTDNIFVHHVPDMDCLVDCVRYQLPALVSRHNVGLVVVDSVAAAFRVEEDSGEMNRSIPLQAMGYRLHHLAASYGLVVVTLNQVTAAMGTVSLYGIRGDVTPALGLSWANLITTRLMMTRTASYRPAIHGKMQLMHHGPHSSGKNVMEFNSAGSSRKLLAAEYNVSGGVSDISVMISDNKFHIRDKIYDSGAGGDPGCILGIV